MGKLATRTIRLTTNADGVASIADGKAVEIDRNGVASSDAITKPMLLGGWELRSLLFTNPDDDGQGNEQKLGTNSTLFVRHVCMEKDVDRTENAYYNKASNYTRSLGVIWADKVTNTNDVTEETVCPAIRPQRFNNDDNTEFNQAAFPFITNHAIDIIIEFTGTDGNEEDGRYIDVEIALWNNNWQACVPPGFSVC